MKTLLGVPARRDVRDEADGVARSGYSGAPFGLGVGDAVFFVADKPEAAWKFAGQARTKVGQEMYERFGMDGLGGTNDVFESERAIVCDS